MRPFMLSTVLFLIVVIVSVLVPANVAAQDTTALPADVLKSLRKVHPRVLATPAEFSEAKVRLQSDPESRRMYGLLKAEAEKLLAEPTVQYVLIGPRLLAQSRLCLHRMQLLGMLYQLDGDSRWVERAKRELFAAADFKDWNPSHFLDVAEMSAAFGIGYDWLYNALTPEERRRIRTALVEKGLRRGEEAYKGTQPWKWWTTVTHNWNQVCNGGLAIGAIAIADEEPELSRFIVSSSLKSIRLAMASFAPDGGWNEGPGYWSFTNQYTIMLLATLDASLGTDFDISKANGYPNTGFFRVHFTSPIGKVFNFADAGDGSGSFPPLRWLARRFNQPILVWEQVRASGARANPLDLLWYQPVTQTPKSTKLPLDSQWKGIQVAFFRSAWEDPNALWIGFKGGDNLANHSHLDLGSFVFDAIGERWAMDFGADNYNLPGYFTNKEQDSPRWTYYRTRTEGQNCALINGENQVRTAKSPLRKFESTPQRAEAIADLSAAYANSGITKFERKIALAANRTQFEFEDRYEAREPVTYVWQMHTAAEIALSADGKTATLTRRGKTMKASIAQPVDARFEVGSVKPRAVGASPAETQNQNEGFRKLLVTLPNKRAKETVSLVFLPMKP